MYMQYCINMHISDQAIHIGGEVVCWDIPYPGRDIQKRDL